MCWSPLLLWAGLHHTLFILICHFFSQTQMGGQMQPNVVMGPIPNQLQGPPGQQSRMPNQPFFPHQRPMRMPRHQTPNNPPLYSSPPSGPFVQFVNPQGAPQAFIPPGQGHPQYHVSVNCFDFMFWHPLALFRMKLDQYSVFVIESGQGWFLCVGKTQDDQQFYHFPTLPDFANIGRLADVCRYRLLTLLCLCSGAKQ